ncbi:MAG: CPXCG motif-containing cysteine-rich protein [Planctomycetaceae bacterium]
MATILFLHGWHSVPGGVKPTYLKTHGHTVVNPALDDDDFDVAVATAQAAFDQNRPQLVVGSSRGGAVAMNMSTGSARLVLLCPSWKKRGTATTVKAGTVILHSRGDDIVPFENSEELIRNSRLPPAALIEVGADHRLADEESLSVLLWVCKMQLSADSDTWFGDDSLLADQRDGLPNSDESTTIDGTYVCDACGEEIVIPLDLAEGGVQTYVEDCPVCCRANTIHVEVDIDGRPTIRATPEQDYE